SNSKTRLKLRRSYGCPTRIGPPRGAGVVDRFAARGRSADVPDGGPYLQRVRAWLLRAVMLAVPRRRSDSLQFERSVRRRLERNRNVHVLSGIRWRRVPIRCIRTVPHAWFYGYVAQDQREQ